MAGVLEDDRLATLADRVAGRPRGMRGLENYYRDPYYQDYAHGKPAEAAEKIEGAIKGAISDIEEALDMAGGFLSPGLKLVTGEAFMELLGRIR